MKPNTTLLLDEVDRLKNIIYLKDKENNNLKDLIFTEAKQISQNFTETIKEELLKNMNQQKDFLILQNQIEELKCQLKQEQEKYKSDIEEEFKRFVVFNCLDGNRELLIQPLRQVLMIYNLKNNKPTLEEKPKVKPQANLYVDFEDKNYLHSNVCWCGKSKDAGTEECLKCKNLLDAFMQRKGIGNYAMAREEMLNEIVSQKQEVIENG